MDSQTTILIIGALVIIAFALLYFQIKKLTENKNSDETTKLLTQLVSDMRGSMDKTTSSMVMQTKAINERLDRAAQVISGVSKSVGEMTELGRSMKDLQEFLRSPKLRGQIGESILKDLLGQTLPKQNFHLQYAFKSGEIVDAAIKLEQGIIPIDAKFPMENFRKMAKSDNEKDRDLFRKAFIADVKKHIDAISTKYIRPQEGTLDFALMYIPSEAVYYEVVNIPELSNFARKLRVYPVSPNTLYAHLQVLLLSFEGKDLEAKSREVFRILRAIQKDYGKVEENMGVLQKHLTNAFNTMSTVYGSFTQLGQKISSTQKLGSGEKHS